MMLEFWGSTKMLEDDAKGILSLLWHAYPNHPWSVHCRPGVIFIKDMSFPVNWGMALKVSEIDHDAAVMKKKIIMLAGEWLERANKKRGIGEDQDVNRVEGVPEQFQPHKPLDNMVVEIDTRFEHRTEPRPQALKEQK
jgi:hypothetical protein